MGSASLHANKKIETTDMKPLKDADGKFFVRDMVELGKAKGRASSTTAGSRWATRSPR